MATLRRVFAAVDAGFEAQVLWRGAGLDRLVDADHARLAPVSPPIGCVGIAGILFLSRRPTRSTGSVGRSTSLGAGEKAEPRSSKRSRPALRRSRRPFGSSTKRSGWCAIASPASGSVGSRDPSDACWCYRTTPQRAVPWRDTPPPSTSPCPRGAPLFADGCASRREIWPGSCSWIPVRASSWTRPDSACAPPPPDIAEGDARSASLGARAPPTTQGDRRGRAAGLTDPSIAWSDIRRELAAGAARTPRERLTGRRSPRPLRSPRRDPHP